MPAASQESYIVDAAGHSARRVRQSSLLRAVHARVRRERGAAPEPVQAHPCSEVQLGREAPAAIAQACQKSTSCSWARARRPSMRTPTSRREARGRRSAGPAGSTPRSRASCRTTSVSRPGRRRACAAREGGEAVVKSRKLRRRRRRGLVREQDRTRAAAELDVLTSPDRPGRELWWRERCDGGGPTKVARRGDGVVPPHAAQHSHRLSRSSHALAQLLSAFTNPAKHQSRARVVCG